jgi:hypothetical protein
MILRGILGANCLKAKIPTWPEQCVGSPTFECSSKIDTEIPRCAAASAAAAPLTPHPTTAKSICSCGIVHASCWEALLFGYCGGLVFDVLSAALRLLYKFHTALTFHLP